MADRLWKYITPGIPDDLFEQLPGIPMTQREVRLLMIAALKLEVDSIVWDIGAGTGTIPVETGLLCTQGQIIAIERDEEVANLIRHNCDLFGVQNVKIIEGNAPECLAAIPEKPQRVCIEGGRSIAAILEAVWSMLANQGRVVATASNLESLYAVLDSFTKLHGRNIEVVQAAINRLETRGMNRSLVAVDPIFILSAEKLDS
jgi:precorrin-6Y C5,15-methyltransferase (decarboxylating)/cobalt-precorrin-6B (C15)-methyltransferase